MRRDGAVRIVAAAELRALARDGRLVWVFALLVALGLAAALSGAAALRGQRAEIDAAKSADRAAWLEQGPRNPHSAAHFGMYAWKPAGALAAFDPGVDRHVGRGIWMEAHYQNPARFRPVEDETSLARFASLSAVVVLQQLVPLLLIFAAFGSIAVERERGALREVLAQGVSPSAIAAGKLLALGLLAVAPLVVVVAAVGGVSAIAGQDSGDTLRWALLALTLLLLYLSTTGLAVAISARAGSLRRALVLGLALWIAQFVLLPRAAAEAAERLEAVPAASDFWRDVRADQEAGINGHAPADERYRRLEAETLARYGVKRLEDLPVNFDGIALQAGEEFGNLVFDRRWGELWETYFRQERTLRWAAFFAPGLAARSVSMALAGTDLAHHRHFAQAAEAHRRALQKQLNAEMSARAGKEGFDWKADPELWERVPEFAYVPPGFRESLSGRQFELALLFAWCVGSLAWAFRSVRRIPPV